jgi:hypothetical protein
MVGARFTVLWLNKDTHLKTWNLEHETASQADPRRIALPVQMTELSQSKARLCLVNSM